MIRSMTFYDFGGPSCKKQRIELIAMNYKYMRDQNLHAVLIAID